MKELLVSPCNLKFQPDIWVHGWPCNECSSWSSWCWWWRWCLLCFFIGWFYFQVLLWFHWFWSVEFVWLLQSSSFWAWQESHFAHQSFATLSLQRPNSYFPLVAYECCWIPIRYCLVRFGMLMAQFQWELVSQASLGLRTSRKTPAKSFKTPCTDWLLG